MLIHLGIWSFLNTDPLGHTANPDTDIHDQAVITQYRPTPSCMNDTLGHTIIPKHFHTRSYSYSQTLTHLAKVLQNTNSLLYHTSQMLPHFHTRPKHTWSYCYHHILTNSFFVVVDDIFSDIIVNIHHIRVFLLSPLAGVDDENQNQNYKKRFK